MDLICNRLQAEMKSILRLLLLAIGIAVELLTAILFSSNGFDIRI